MERKVYLAVSGLMIMAVVFSAAMVFAGKPVKLDPAPDFQEAAVNHPVTNDTMKAVEIPSTAVQAAPNIYFIGEAADPGTGKPVQGYAIVTYAGGFAKPTGCNDDGTCQGWEDPSCEDCTGGGGEPGTGPCYGFIFGEGVRWNTAEPYMVDPSNRDGLGEEFVRDNMASNIQKWEDAAGMDIFGDEVEGENVRADTVSPDGRNEVHFADIVGPGASKTIAMTIVWISDDGTEIVEWDHVYDDFTFDWADCATEDCIRKKGKGGKMDFENIATHELGHSFGLNDLYEDACSEQTMYGYAKYGETKKRTLEEGDTAGIQALYGT